MKIIFVSNFLNHHQIHLCEELKAKVDEFYFIATDNGDEQGYQKSQNSDYVIDYNKDTTRAENEILSAEAVIFGACHDKLVELRMRDNKLSFIYSERIFKKGIWRCLIPRNFKMLKRRYLNYKDKNLYVLAASAFLPYDLSLFNFPIKKIFKWGYFPEVEVSNVSNKEKNTILYAGRLIKLKHVETVIETAKLLKQDGLDFKVNIVGDGPEKENLLLLRSNYELDDHVDFLGSKSHEEVLEIMQKSSIYMLTSDFNEGWGAVLNEAMANSCAVVASSAVGSVPFLINHAKNGLIYKYGDSTNAYNAVKKLLLNPEMRDILGKNASQTINNYNYQIATEKLVNAINEFYENGCITPATADVFSSVNVIKNNWFK